jgi:hypothetical protein
MEVIFFSSKCKILQINSINVGFLALQVFVNEWWSGWDDDKVGSCDNGWGE